MQLKSSSRWRRVPHFLACMAIATALTGSSGPAAQAQTYSTERPAALPGTVIAFEEVALYGKIPSFVKKWNVDIGDRVKKDSVLAELAMPEIEKQLKHKEALVLKAQTGVERAKLGAKVAAATLERARAGVKIAEAGLLASKADLDRWHAEYERAAKLVKQNVVDQATLDEASNKLKTADAAVQQGAAKIKSAEALVDEAAAQREKADADIQGAETDLVVAKADAEYVSALLQYAVIRAPFDGVVTRRNVNTGDYVVPPSGGKGEPLFIVARVDRVRVVCQVSEKDSVRVVTGMKAVIGFQALDGKEFKGAVTRTSWALDPMTHALNVEIYLDNADDKLRPGMYATVVLNPKN
jgi:HlyD family secretion protein